MSHRNRQIPAGPGWRGASALPWWAGLEGSQNRLNPMMKICVYFSQADRSGVRSGELAGLQESELQLSEPLGSDTQDGPLVH